MKILKAIDLEKYSDTSKYTHISDHVYEDSTGGVGGRMGITKGSVYCVTLYSELEDGDTVRYPLEDILDKYYVNCTDVMEEKEEDGKRVFVFEIEGKNLKAIQTIAGFVGKRAFNYQEGRYIKLCIE